MKLYSIYTDEMEEIRQIFLNSMKDDWEVHIEYFGKAGKGNGDFHTQGWIDIQKRKLDFIISKIEANPGDVIIWSDIDIQFFAKCTPLIEQAIEGKDIVFQAEYWPKKDEINSGFSVIRCNERSLALYRTVAQYDLDKLQVADQTAINNILKKNEIGIKWDVLPSQFWAMSHYMYNSADPPLDVVLHHANCTSPQIIDGKVIGSIELKLQQFELLKEYVRANKYEALP